MATLWPMEVTRVGKHEFLRFKKITSMEGLRVTPLLDFDQFKGIPTRWISLLHQFILNGSKPMKKQVATPLLITGPDTSLLNMLADRGFGTLKGGLIKRILESEYAQEVPETWSSADQVVQLVKIVKKCSDLEAAEILLGRAAGVDDHEAEQELLGSELVQDCLQASDRKEVHEFLQTSSDDIAFTKELKICIKAIRKKKGVKKRKGVKFKSSKTWTTELALPLFPPDSKLYSDTFNGRWRVYLPGGWNRSRSWGWDGGDERCIRDLATLAWGFHEDLTGEACPIVGL